MRKEMAEQSTKSAWNDWIRRVFVWLLGLASFGVLAMLLGALILRFTTPVAPHKFQLIHDVILPDIVTNIEAESPQNAALATRVDRFDFQALDVQAGLLFIAHPGPSANKFQSLPSGLKLSRSIIVVNIKTNQVVRNIAVPFIHGIAIAPNLHKVYAVDADESKLYVIDELKQSIITSIKLTQNPDALEYDQEHKQIFISEPGIATPPRGMVDVVDAFTDKIIQTVPFSNDVAHIHYDEIGHRIAVVVVDPQGKGELDTIDPVAFQIGSHVALPDACAGPHGLALDAQQQMAFIACVDSCNLVTVDLATMKVLSDPHNLPPLGIKSDMLTLDRKLHVLFVASTTSITVFDESQVAQHGLHLQGDYIISSGNTHTIMVDDMTHDVYIPVADLAGRPLLRVMHYNMSGI